MCSDLLMHIKHAVDPLAVNTSGIELKGYDNMLLWYARLEQEVPGLVDEIGE